VRRLGNEHAKSCQVGGEIAIACSEQDLREARQGNQQLGFGGSSGKFRQTLCGKAIDQRRKKAKRKQWKRRQPGSHQENSRLANNRLAHTRRTTM
jgi:hypothetical protein